MIWAMIRERVPRAQMRHALSLLRRRIPVRSALQRSGPNKFQTIFWTTLPKFLPDFSISVYTLRLIGGLAEPSFDGACQADVKLRGNSFLWSRHQRGNYESAH